MSQILPSWKDGAARAAILDFVAAVTTDGGPDYRPPAERIAVFDNDGTLWCEQPLQVQVLFAHERAAAMAKADPSLMERPAIKAFLTHDMAAIKELGKQGVFEFAFAVHAGMSIEAFQDAVRDWMASAVHPKLARPYDQVVYQPQLELLGFLRENGFKVFIVSGGGVDFIRAFAERVYGVPPEQVVGSSVQTKLSEDGRELIKQPALFTFDDRAVKPQNIALHIGRRPILAFGNSDGDQEMMRYTLAGDGRRLALLVHHDDDERETAYDRDFRLSPLTETLDRATEFGITVVSVRKDWAQVFPAN